ncbi:MAG: glucose-1-phosphate thymidylyltransferase [Chitinophagia bacterium]|nr:glucose-1-phosphate thymidylyltransferase [Chitinophagia bacterium]
MNFILFEQDRERLFPFTHTRAVADIRCGILTMRERWELLLGQSTGTLTAGYLQGIYPSPAEGDAIYINGAVFATEALVAAIGQLQPGQRLVNNATTVAFRTGTLPFTSDAQLAAELPRLSAIEAETPVLHLARVWDIFSMNGAAIRADFPLVTNGRTSAPLPENIIVNGKDQVFLESGAVINAGCIINASAGPVYIGKSAELLEGVMMRGPVALGEKAVLKMGAKVYADTTIGDGCKVGGEISNVVFFANSNKGHDGYLGNAVIGEWCNLGADTNCSNLKNNYDEVKIWDEQEDKLVKTGLTFIGLLMGDHSKCGINTMFNTGTVVGVSCNIYGGGFPEKFIPSFSWGGSDGMQTYAFDKAMQTAGRMMERRHKSLSEAELAMYRNLFDSKAEQRERFHQNAGNTEN